MSISSLRISGSALTAERERLDAISENIANAETTRGPDGRPYRRRQVVFEAIPDQGASPRGVRVQQVTRSTAPLPRVYNPGHPDADAQGYVEMPNVNIVEEMVDLVTATRAYEANVNAANATKSITSHAIELGRV